MVRRRCALTLILALAGLLLAAPAVGQEEFDSVDDLLNKAQRYAESGRLKAGLKLYRKVLDQEPGNESALFSLVILSNALQEFADVVLFGTAFLYVAETDLDKEEVQGLVASAEAKMTHPARLRIKIYPVDSLITINGIPVGKGAVEMAAQVAETYRIKGAMDDYVSWEDEIQLESDEDKSITKRLEKIIYKGTLTIKVIPDSGVEVFVDTKVVGTDKFKMKLVEGKRLICFKKEGWDRWWRYVDIPRNGKIELEAQLEKTGEMDGPCNVWPSD